VTGSVVDLTAIVSKETSAAEVNAAFKAAAEGDGWMGKVFEYTEDPVVSTDFIGYDASSTIDGLSTEVSGGNMVKVVTWYDNEWGYSCRLADLCALVAEQL
jgi:glyceraldehyde 3-phosphate dehydrogenase